MPKRILDDSLLSSPSLAKCTPRAQDAFPRFILLMDDFGCAEANPRVLLGRGWPLREDVTERDVWAWLEEYVRVGMACLWTEKERRWVHLTGWNGPHGQKPRAEYDPNAPKGTPGRHGSKRKTPRPPEDLVAAVMAGARRDHDGKPPGVDREDGDEFPNDSIPARETGGNTAGGNRETPDSRSVPAPAVPVAVPDADELARLPRARRAKGEPTSAPEPATVAEPPPPSAAEAASGVEPFRAAPAASDAARELAATTAPIERQEVPHAVGPGNPATHPSAADEPPSPSSAAAAPPLDAFAGEIKAQPTTSRTSSTAPSGAPEPASALAAAMLAPPTPGYVSPGMRPRPGPVEDDVPRRAPVFVDASELPEPAATVRGELERQLGRKLAKAGAEDFAAHVARLEAVGEGEALRVCVEAAAEFQRRTGGERPGSLSWFAGAMAQFLGLPALGAPPPLPPAGCPEWERVREALQAKVRDDPFRRWFAPLVGRMFNGALVLEAPDEMHAAFVRDNYEPLLVQGAVAGLGGRVDVVIVAAAPRVAAGGAA